MASTHVLHDDDTTIITQHESVAETLHATVYAFKSILNHISESTSSSEIEQYSFDPWDSEFVRLRIWAANVGAHRSGRASLDFRLRDSSHIRQQVIKLLQSLAGILEETLDLLRNGDGAKCDEPMSDEDNSPGADESDQSQLLSSARLHVDLLFEMIVTIMKPAKLDRFSKVIKDLGTAFQPYDLQHIENKFPQAESSLQKMLANALSYRRGVLKLYDQRHEAYARGIEQAFDQPKLGATPGTIGAATSAMLSSAAYNEMRAIDDMMSVVSGSAWSMTSILDARRDLHIQIPSELQDRKPFACPYCHYLIDFYEPRDFVRHVFDDITPFQCIFSACTYSTDLSGSKKGWVKHMKTHHSKEWQQLSETACPMCKATDLNGQTMTRHVARHLQDLAIFTLPLLESTDHNVESADDSTSERSTRSMNVNMGNQQADVDLITGSDEDQDITEERFLPFSHEDLRLDRDSDLFHFH